MFSCRCASSEHACHTCTNCNCSNNITNQHAGQTASFKYELSDHPLAAPPHTEHRTTQLRQTQSRTENMAHAALGHEGHQETTLERMQYSTKQVSRDQSPSFASSEHML